MSPILQAVSYTHLDVYKRQCQDRLFTLGPIIHNEEVVNDLEKKGVRVASEEELKTLPKGSTVVIRSHGVGKKVYDQLKECGLSYVDVTCPFVLKIHRIVEKESKAGSHIVIIGDPDHPCLLYTSFFEVKADYGKSVAVGFIRLNGATVGAVANRSESYDEMCIRDSKYSSCP